MNSRLTALVIAMLVLGCDRSEEPADAEAAVQEDTEAAPQTRPLPPMPEHPPARTGRLSGRSAGGVDTVSGVWRAHATRCENPPALQVVAGDEHVGTILLYQLDSIAPVAENYRVTSVDSGFGRSPSVQLAVQLTPDGGIRAFRAASGTATLERLDGETTGQFAVTLKEVDSLDSLRYVGVFQRVPVGPGSVEDCRTIREGRPVTRDSTLSRTPSRP